MLAGDGKIPNNGDVNYGIVSQHNSNQSEYANVEDICTIPGKTEFIGIILVCNGNTYGDDCKW